MNRYGRMALDHTRQHRPKNFASMVDPVSYFSRLGAEIEGRITQLRDRVLDGQGTAETLEDYRQRSYQAQRQAEEIVLAEMVWTEPEPTTEPEDDQILSYRSQLATASRTLASLDRAWADTTVEPPPQP